MKRTRSRELWFAALAAAFAALSFSVRPTGLPVEDLWPVIFAVCVCAYAWGHGRRRTWGVIAAPGWILATALLVGLIESATGTPPTAQGRFALRVGLWCGSAALMLSGLSLHVPSRSARVRYEARRSSAGQASGLVALSESVVLFVAISLASWLATSERHAGALAIWGFFLAQSLRSLSFGGRVPKRGPHSDAAAGADADEVDPFESAATSLRTLLTQP